MVQQHVFDIAALGEAQSVDQEAVLRFDATGAVRAIVFHLLDEKLAKSVAAETIARTVERLTAKSIQPSIARRRWIAMSNSQRLRWMLAESKTVTFFGVNGAARLRARRSR